jgi:hypothetical protein
LKSLPKSVKSPKGDGEEEEDDSGDLENYIMQMKLVANPDDNKKNETTSQGRLSKSLEKSSHFEDSRSSISKQDEALKEAKKEVTADEEEDEDEDDVEEDHKKQQMTSPKERPLSVRSSQSGLYFTHFGSTFTHLIKRI